MTTLHYYNMIAKRYIPLLLCALLASACHHKNRFTVQGTVSGAGGETLYLEAVRMQGIEMEDSLILDASGKYKLQGEAPEYPEFYRLRLGNAYINFAVDSTETITIDAPKAGFASGYTVGNSENSEKIRQIALSGQKLKGYIDRYKAQTDGDEEDLLEQINEYKQQVLPFIYSAPYSTAAYFAIFQQIDGQYIFDLYDKNDSKAIRAVATQYDFRYKNSERARQLRQMVIESMKVKQLNDRAGSIQEIEEVSSIDIALPDIYGKKQALSELKGKVVLLDFTMYQAEFSPQYNRQLAEVYQKYKEQGFEIYQVSLDSDEHFWKVSASNLPWKCVRDASSLESRIAGTYNVQQLPTAYLLDRTGAICTRLTSSADIGKEIEKLL